MKGRRSHDAFAATLRRACGRQVEADAGRLWLDARGVEASMAYNLAFDMRSSVAFFLCKSLQNAWRFSDNAGA